MKNYSIVLSEGVGDITFSMNADAVKKVLGKPENIDDLIENELVYYYSDLGINVVFNRLNNTFLIKSIEVENDIYTLWNSPILFKRYEETLQFLTDNNILGYREDCHSETKYIFFKNVCLEFNNNILDLISIENPNI